MDKITIFIITQTESHMDPMREDELSALVRLFLLLLT